MNERIKEIGRQAGFAFISDGVFGQRWYESKCGMDKAEFEKFAELIVRECADLLEVEYGQSALTGNAAAKSVKKHFGVEE